MTQPSSSLDIRIIAFEDVHLEVVRYTDGWDSAAYQEQAASLRISPSDLRRLGIKNGAHVRLTAAGGTVVVKAKSDNRCEEAVAWLPAGLYSSFLGVYDPHLSRIPSPKVFPASVSPTQDELTSALSLFQRTQDA